MKTLTSDFLQQFGVTRADLLRHGLSYQVLWSHLNGVRRMKGEKAIEYERVGIPRSTLRPDLWKSNG